MALATDGFNPYGMSTRGSLIIPEHLGNNINAYKDILIDELVRGWEEGIWTYDRATKINFEMYVWYHYSLHDLLVYGIFCS